MTKCKNPSKGKKKRQRLRMIEGLLLDGYGAQEITDMLPANYQLAYGTIRNQIVEVRDAWAADVDARDELEGRHRYLSSLRQLRKRALEGWEEEGKFGTILKGVDNNLAHVLDKEIARLSGVNLKADTKNINITVDAAREYLDSVMEVIFQHVDDDETIEKIIDSLSALDENQ